MKSLVNAINPLTLRSAYQTFLPIKAAKLADVNQLLRFVHLAENVSFYSVLRSDDRTNELEDEFE